MKKGMIYVAALTLCIAIALAGCGEMRSTDGGAVPPTSTPVQTMLPETMMPQPEDGVVRDRDGIITDGDSGTVSDGAESGSAGNGTGIPKTAESGKR